ncbi:B12-binding domain-containing radical SAM protein [Phosphitispora fastidiosa]|uniref:B12-binding domain-containing radical SAM protein n=1 Tax=Phosphitispora fastidiosa TaxID=2837202 RepID=UPI001E3CCDDF|nr:radical SAM protein [Phosphitispora fastidiosa]MBU7006994.1 radical SAM superfamily enzyme YgiQ (UPF0313 family) [Phosphitispora fastidiosa]
MKKKLLLIQPTPYDSSGSLIKRRKLYFVGLALPLLAALTPEAWEIELALETIEEVDLETDAQVIGISSMGHSVIRAIELAKEYRNRGKTVIMGGYMVSLMAEEAGQYCDAVVIGDAEGVWRELLLDWEAGQLKKIYRAELDSLENLPLPRYDLLTDKAIGDFLPVQAGRGCPHSCSFCSVHCLYRGKYLKRSIPEVIRDIKYVKSLGYNRFLLLDDNIVSDEGYMLELVREIAKLKMQWFSQCDITAANNPVLLKALKDSGCLVLSFGLESISQESLDSLNKAWAKVQHYPDQIQRIRQAGIEVSTEMVVGTDADTEESILATANFIAANKISVPRFYILTPIPGTDLFNQLRSEGRICNENIYSYNGTEAVHVPARMSPQQLTKAYWELYNRVYSWTSIIKRTLLTRNFLANPIQQLFYFLVNLKYRQDIRKGIPPNII